MSFWVPTSLNQIVGNPHSLELLRAILGNLDRAPLAYVFEGASGTGKSTIAKLFFKQMFPENKIVVVQPDHFSQVLQQEDLTEYPCMIWDHANCLSKEQADQLCAHLDRSDIKTVFVFITSEYIKTHQGLRSRALRIPCTKPSQTELAGLLGSICASHNLNFELEALNAIAGRSNGFPSRAILELQAVSLLGSITVDTVGKLQETIDDQAVKLLYHVDSEQSILMDMVDSVKDTYPPEEFVAALFNAYSRVFFDKSKISELISKKLSNYKKVGEIFIKWTSASSLPPSALFILFKELIDSNKAEIVQVIQTTVPDVHTALPPPASKSDMRRKISETSKISDPSIR